MSDPESVLEVEPSTKGERTRQRLLEIAIHRFGERGYRSTSVSEIARAAGLTQAAVYAYFENKEALFDAAVDADAASIIHEARRRTEGTGIHDLVLTLFLHILGLMEQHTLAQRVLAGREQAQLARLLNLPALAEMTAWIAEETRRAQSAGIARTDVDAQAFADGAETLMLGLLMAVLQVGGSHEARRQIGVATVFERLLRPPG